MERFYKRKAPCPPSTSTPTTNNASNLNDNVANNINMDDLPFDPSERPKIISYKANQRDEVIRAYLTRGASQPRNHAFPNKYIANKARRFVPSWFDEFPWLEYSTKVDRAYCLNCYLFKDQGGNHGTDAFVTDGWNSWNKKDRLKLHEGEVNSFHHKAIEKCENLMNQNQSITNAITKQKEGVRIDNLRRLNASVEVCRYLLGHGLPFCGNDESENSRYKGLFLGTLKFLGRNNEDIQKVILQNAPKNLQMTSPKIQKDIIACFAEEILKYIIGEIGDGVFAILVDESSDVSRKEQMAVVLRFVDKKGFVKERFIGIVHVMDTTALSLKSSIDNLFAKHGLSLTKVRGQGYDGASNMRGQFNGLKALILKDNESAFYVHCFAHQLQLVVVAVAKKHDGVKNFFDLLALVVTVFNSSCKRTDILREAHKDRIQKQIGNGEIETDKGLNQESSLVRAGDTRWNSHLRTITSLLSLFPDVIKILEYIKDDGENGATRLQASGLLLYFETFEFVFYLHLLLTILGLTNALSQALQKKDQDILEAVDLIRTTKGQLQEFRENGFDGLLEKCYSFCDKNNIVKLVMAETYVNTRNPRKRMNIDNKHHYNFDVFNTILDMQNQEFGDRFCEISTDLLQRMEALNPRDSFSRFEKSSLLKLSEMYPRDFDEREKIILEHDLDIYHRSVLNDVRFNNLNSIADLARLMVTTGKHNSYPLVYRLLKLALVLPVATATVERCFSVMKLVKTDLRNRIGDDFLNAALICDIENDIHDKVKNEDVIERFQNMKTRRGLIPN